MKALARSLSYTTRFLTPASTSALSDPDTEVAWGAAQEGHGRGYQSAGAGLVVQVSSHLSYLWLFPGAQLILCDGRWITQGFHKHAGSGEESRNFCPIGHCAICLFHALEALPH